jgi:hypothetical protein
MRNLLSPIFKTGPNKQRRKFTLQRIVINRSIKMNTKEERLLINHLRTLRIVKNGMTDILKKLFVGGVEGWVLEERLNLSARNFLCSNQPRSCTIDVSKRTKFFNHNLKSRKLRKRRSLAIKIEPIIRIKRSNAQMNRFINPRQMRRFRLDKFPKTRIRIRFLLPSLPMLLVILLQILRIPKTFCTRLYVSR